MKIPKATSLADLVNSHQGTDSHPAFSTGNTLPLVTRPHGMTAWIAQTGEGRWCHDFRAPKIQGFRATRQPSPWIADYGQFLLAPTTGDKPPRSLADTESFHRRENTIARPHHYRARLDRWGIVAEMTATERCAHFQFTIEEGENTWLYVKVAQGTELRLDRETNQILGVSTANQGGVAENFGSYFVIAPGAPVLEAIALKAPVDSPDAPDNGKPLAAALALRLQKPAGKKLVVAAATSLISHAQARLNLGREIGKNTFAQTLAKSRAAWNRRLACVQIEATEAQKRLFYSCLHRCFIFPRPIHEYDAAGKQVHWSPFTGKIHPGPLYTDSGFWDIYRTLL
ncbi:MAG: glycoside hydrolase family 92 protein, partial [Opitutaceae bacterium]|nr:glycoside hydrolase family 92 protein [Opitutaceae bacterium]